MYKLLSRNIGIKIDNQKQVSDFIHDGNYDIVCLQETTKAMQDSVLEQYQTYDLLKKELSYEYDFFGDVWESDGFHHRGRMFGGLIRQGNTTFSNYPFVMAENKFFYRNFERRYDRLNFRQLDHGRSLSHQIIDLGGDKRLQLINIHGCYTDDKKDNERSLNQSRFILEQINQYNIPTIIVGDFNVDSTTQSIEMMRKELIDLTKLYEIKSTRPVFDDGSESSKGQQVIDYIFVSEDIVIDEFKVSENHISDHFPLELGFNFKQ